MMPRKGIKSHVDSIDRKQGDRDGAITQEEAVPHSIHPTLGSPARNQEDEIWKGKKDVKGKQAEERRPDNH